MEVTSAFANSVHTKFVKIKWNSKVGKEPPFLEEWAKVMAICSQSRMVHLQPYNTTTGKLAHVNESPWVNLQTIAYVYVAKMPPNAPTGPETVDYDEEEARKKAEREFEAAKAAAEATDS